MRPDPYAVRTWSVPAGYLLSHFGYIPTQQRIPVRISLDIATNSKLKQTISAIDARGQKRIGHSFWTLHRPRRRQEQEEINASCGPA
jgi:hypothetical protein